MTRRMFAKPNLIVIITLALIASLAFAPLASATDTDYQKAVKLYNAGKYEQAIPLFKSSINSNQHKPDTYFMLGYSLYKIGKHEEAREYFQKSYNENPEFSPTPKLEQKLNRRLDVARPGPDDEKTSVPKGTLPPEVRDLDPSEYKIIDQSERLSMPDGSMQSTDKFEPVKNKPAAKQAEKMAQNDTTPPPAAKITEVEAKPDAEAVANTPAPAAEEEAAKEAASSVEEDNAEDVKPRPRTRPSKPPKPKGFVENTLDTLNSFMPEGMSMVTLGIIAGGAILYLILTIVMIKIVKNNNMKKLFLGLALLPVIQLTVIILAKRSGKGPSAAAATDAGGGIPDLGGEPNLDLPDVDDMGFDMDDDFGGEADDFATDSGFGSDEGVGGEADDFATEPDEGFDDDFAAPDDDFDAGANDSGGDDFDMEGGFDEGDDFNFDEESKF